MRRATQAAALVTLAWGCGSHQPAPAPAPPPAPGPAAAAPLTGLSVEREDRYYDIYGSSVAELREQIRRLGPGGGDDALTVWDLEWTFGDSRTMDGCALRDVRVTLTLTTTLPRWTPPQDAAPAVVQAWRDYLQHVRLHEGGHRQIAERNARDLLAALTGMHGPGGCDALRTQASRTAEQIVADGRARNRAYDVETKHGQTQGVALPP